MAQSPVDPKLLFFQSKGTHWVSSDAGGNFEPVRPKFPLSGVQFHPYQRNWALAFGTGGGVPGCVEKPGVECMGHLMLTKDAGSTWDILLSTVKPTAFEWQQHHDKNSLNLDRSDSAQQRIVAVESPQESRMPSGVWDTGYQLVASDDWFKSKTVLMPAGNLFVSSGRLLFVVKAESQAHVNLLVSSDGGTTWHKAKSSADSLALQRPHSFGVLHDQQESAVLIAVKPSFTSETSTLWVSGTAGRHWAPSLSRVHYPHGGPADLCQVEGLAGVYLVNQMLGARVSSKLKTRISFDRGRVWSSVAAPSAGELL
eukprot:TRINITY_DN4037_c0_g1_i2.p1 TRINITY_DN4037_c0_g1~~TRINITY_DN4037_c0_g1_i2.p1  ORF type:complete len:312 (-),score=62.14 TRINITY_DN4037_c0_g1_i2:1418-2353(-)